MRTDGSVGDGLRTTGLVMIDAIGYAVGVAVVSLVASLVVAVATGGGLVRAKALLFLAGFSLMAYATVRLWPSSPDDLESAGDRGARGYRTGEPAPLTDGETRFQSLVGRMPPLRWVPAPPPARRMVPASKLFLGSVCVLLVSFLMEAVFGIA